MGSGKEHDNRDELDASTVKFVLKETKELIRSLEGTATRRVKVRAGALEIEVERRESAPVWTGAAHAGAGAAPAGAPAEAPSAAAAVMPVVAPLVGVFYRAPSPGARPFVEVGDTVERGQKVGV
ncbi:MAG TPA: hypothetical protein VJ144_03865, partial [Candidatus Polarisedimenticolia bacterium]|nr:hypothetical protein [Candidatus Polarisedimenticolia bacterium]